VTHSQQNFQTSGCSIGGTLAIHRDERAEALAGSAAQLRGLRDSIAVALDAVEAERVRQRLLAED
jgi:hypothetical protein